MKIAVIGLGSFGFALCSKLTEAGHEVIGIDKRMERIELISDEIAQAVALDSTEERSIAMLPLKELNAAVVAIGGDPGASMLTSALLRKNGVKRIFSRAISPIHGVILESMGVENILYPEHDSAEKLSRRLSLRGLVGTFPLNEDYAVTELKAPESLHDERVGDVNFQSSYQLSLVTIVRKEQVENSMGRPHTIDRVLGTVLPSTQIQPEDLLVLFGKKSDITKFGRY